MGVALELLSFFDLDAPAAFAAMTNCTGNSNTVRNASANSKVLLLTAWAKAVGAINTFRIRSPLLHDNQQGIRFTTAVSDPAVMLDPSFPTQLFPQDALLIEDQSADAGTNIHILSMLVYFEDLPGVAANLVSSDYVRSRGEARMSGENTLALGTAGDYSGEEAINAELDQMKANRYYALLGYTLQPVCGTIRWRGVDTGNLGVGGPGAADDPFFTQNFFVWLSERSGKNCIPVFNSANRAAILIDGVQDEGGVDPTVASQFMLLRA